MSKSLCIAVLNYNGIEFLEELVPSLRAALKEWSKPASVVILDNHSTAPVREWAEANCPEFEFILAKKNQFLFSYNDLISSRPEDIFILLNNDIKVDKNFIAPLVKHFDSDDVFSVGSTSKDWEGKRITTGPWFLGVRKGLYYWDCRLDAQRLSHTFLTVGGHMAVSRAKFLELGGFNLLFYPAYCEETELCLRAWRRGWRCIFEPDSLVYHYDGGSFNKNTKKASIQLRSYFLMQFACLPAIKPQLLSSLYILLRLIRYTFTFRFYWPKTYFLTLLEWSLKKSSYEYLKCTPENLNSVMARIHQNP
jgi:GT2 family glycosyltransferase